MKKTLGICLIFWPMLILCTGSYAAMQGTISASYFIMGLVVEVIIGVLAVKA